MKEFSPSVGSIRIWYDMKYRFYDELKEYEPEDGDEEVN